VLKATKQFNGWYFENDVAILQTLASLGSLSLSSTLLHVKNHIVPKYEDHWSTPMSDCVVMERFGSTCLETVLEQGTLTTLQAEEVRQEYRRLADSLAAAGISHGDMHLKNILVDFDAAHHVHLRVIDFERGSQGMESVMVTQYMAEVYNNEEIELRLAAAGARQ